jgi:hypothetical protein
MAADERRLLAEQLLDVAEKRIEEADGTDCSRIAWLCLALDQEGRAREIAGTGLQLEPDNEHCRNLINHLNS